MKWNNIKLNKYKNIKSPQVNNKSDITISDWLDLIKNGSTYTQVIQLARTYGKGHEVYDQLKLTVPCITYSFTFKNRKKNANIKTSTGLIYIDIDDSSFDINSIDTSKILAYYKSFGGNGYGIIVRVDTGLNLDNFKSTYDSIITDLGINNYVDANAVKPTQYSVLSYDEDLFVNDNPKVYNVVNPSNGSNGLSKLSSNDNEYKKLTYPMYNIKEEGHIHSSSQLFKYKNYFYLDNLHILSQHIVNEEYEVHWDGIDWIKIYLPVNKLTDGRKRFFLSFYTNLVYLNPNKTYHDLLEFGKMINNWICIEPLKISTLRNKLDAVIKQKEDGTLTPIPYYKKRKFLFNQYRTISKEEKLKIVNIERAKRFDAEAIELITNAIDDWDFKTQKRLTPNKLSKLLKMGRDRIRKQWDEFEWFVDDLNLQHGYEPYKKRIKAVDPTHEIIQLDAEERYADLCYIEYMDEVTGNYEWYELVA